MLPRPRIWWGRAGRPLPKQPPPLSALRASNLYTKFVQLILTKIIIIDTTRCQILRLKCTKFDATGAPPQTPLGSLQRFPRWLTAPPQEPHRGPAPLSALRASPLPSVPGTFSQILAPDEQYEEIR